MHACRNNRHFVFYLQVGRMAITDYNDTSAFYKYIPVRVRDDYVRYLRHTEVGITIEDRKVKGNRNNNAVLNELSGFMRQLTTDVDEDDAELDMEVAEIFDTKSEIKLEYCQSPKEPWVPQITDDITTAEDRKNLDMNISIIQQMSPITVTPSSSNSYCYHITPENPTDMNSSFIQKINPVVVSPNPGSHHYNQSSLETFSATVRSSSSTGSTEENPAYSEPHADLTSRHNTFPGSDADSPGKKRPSMEELRRMVLDKSAELPGIDRFTQTKEEQFAEILEDFLEENKDLPAEIRDVILDMLTKTRETVAEQKEGILYTAEIYVGDSDDKPNIDKFDRAADDEVMGLINELDLPDLQTEPPDLPTAVTNESSKDVLLDMEANMEEFDRAADDEVMDLINELDLPDLSAAVTSESPNDGLLDVDTNMREDMNEPTIGSVYSTDVFVGADDERLLAEFERVVNNELIFEDTEIAELPGPYVNNINEYSSSKFKSINCFEVEMDSTGQKIYDGIAAFFGCK